MPCDTVSTARVKLNAATVDKTILDSVMRAMGCSAYVLNSDGTITLQDTVRGFRGGEALTAKVNRDYARAVVTSQAKRFGWSIKEQPDGKLLVMKASF